MDRIALSAPSLGAPLLTANFPRIYLDANREPFELDPAMYASKLPDYVNRRSDRVRAGIGTIHRYAMDGSEIYREPLDFADALIRIERCHQPYHAELEWLIRKTRRRFGFCIVLDCHSMPSLIEDEVGDGPLDFVIGDLGGQSCAPAVSERAERVLARRGWAVRRNDPFAGGFTTRRHGCPEQGVHVIQLEVNRALYMDEAGLSATPGFSRISQTVAELVAALGELDLPMAAPSPKIRPADFSARQFHPI